MGTVLLSLGLVFVFEGLVVALAPARVEEMLALFARIPLEGRRLIGLLALVIGAALLALARSLGGI